jgi:hypothetical protein
MILNAYAVVDLFLVLGRLIIAVLMLVLIVLAIRNRAGSEALEAKRLREDRLYLVFLLGFLLVGFNVAAWPVLYLLLQSYVPEWPAAMCIYGVTKVGLGSVGIARFLPRLVTALQWTKPGLLFLTGAWFVLYLVNRRTQTAPLTNRVLLVLAVMGLIAAGDAAAEAAYLLIPKKEEFPSAGCCTVASADGVRFLPRALLDKSSYPWLSLGYYAGNALMIAILWTSIDGAGVSRPAKWLPALLLGALVMGPVSALYWTEIAAPALLHLPYHHCLYDVIPKVPESVVAMALAVLGSFAVGWACVVAWFARCAESEEHLNHELRRLLVLALAGYFGSVSMLTIELMLA